MIIYYILDTILSLAAGGYSTYLICSHFHDAKIQKVFISHAGKQKVARDLIDKILSHFDNYKDWSEVRIRRETVLLHQALRDLLDQ